MQVLIDFENVAGVFTGVPRATQDDVVALIKAGLSPVLWVSSQKFSVNDFFDLDEPLSEQEKFQIKIDCTRPKNLKMLIRQFLPQKLSHQVIPTITSMFPGYLGKTAGIVRIHDPYGHTGKILGEALLWDGKLKLVLARTVRNMAFMKVCEKSLIIPSSKTTAKKLISIYPNKQMKIIVIPCAVGTRLVGRESGNRVRGDYFLMVGGMRQRKRPDLLINLWASEFKSLKTKLVIVGQVDTEKISEYARYLYTKGELIFHQNISTENLRLLQRHALACIFLSEGEGFGRPIAESLLSGTPIIVNNLEVFREFESEFVKFFDLSNLNSLAKLLSDARKPISKHETISCLKYGDKFSYESVGKLWHNTITTQGI